MLLINRLTVLRRTVDSFTVNTQRSAVNNNVAK